MELNRSNTHWIIALVQDTLLTRASKRRKRRNEQKINNNRSAPRAKFYSSSDINHHYKYSEHTWQKQEKALSNEVKQYTK
jgi:hypothetical protein